MSDVAVKNVDGRASFSLRFDPCVNAFFRFSGPQVVQPPDAAIVSGSSGRQLRF